MSGGHARRGVGGITGWTVVCRPASLSSRREQGGAGEGRRIADVLALCASKNRMSPLCPAVSSMRDWQMSSQELWFFGSLLRQSASSSHAQALLHSEYRQYPPLGVRRTSVYYTELNPGVLEQHAEVQDLRFGRLIRKRIL